MKKSGSISPKSPAQYQRSEFYWRGKDPLREEEHLNEEYKRALAEYRKAKFEKYQLEVAVTKGMEILSERDGYSNALASCFDGDKDSLFKEDELKKELLRLENEISEKESQLYGIKLNQNPAYLASLAKELAFLTIEIQRGNKTISNLEEKKIEATKQFSACTISDTSMYSMDLEFQLKQKEKKYSLLRGKLNQLKGVFDTQSRVNLEQTPYFSKQRGEMYECVSTKCANKKLQGKLQHIEEKKEQYLSFLISQIEILNERLIELDLSNEIVNTEELRKKYLDENKKEERLIQERLKKEEKKKLKISEKEKLIKEDKENQIKKIREEKRAELDSIKQRKEEKRKMEEKRENERKADIAKYEARKTEEERKRKLRIAQKPINKPSTRPINEKIKTENKPPVSLNSTMGEDFDVDDEPKKTNEDNDFGSGENSFEKDEAEETGNTSNPVPKPIDDDFEA